MPTPPKPKVGSRAYFRWDENHHQPHTDLGGVRKFLHSWRDVGAWLHLAGRNLRHLPEVVSSYSQVRAATREPLPTPASFFGMAVSPNRATLPRYLERIERLGTTSLLIRVPVWEPEPVFELVPELAALRARGFRFTFSLLQDRQSVETPERWAAFVLRAAEALGPLEPTMQLGQAFNRKKWGVWRPDEYFRLLEGLGAAREAAPKARWVGPAVIDFEYYFTLHWLFGERPFRYDGISALLYCDRRGSPASPQYGHFDLRRKIELLRALVDVSPEKGAPLHLTEFNWPLKGDLRHSPAGPRITTSEALQARYLVLYYLIAAETGLVADAFWWQLVAKGYGLLSDDADWSERPAWRACRTLVARAAGATITRLPQKGAIGGFLLEREGRLTALLSTSGPEVPLDPALRIREAVSVEGEPLVAGAGLRVSEDPVWLELEGISAAELRERGAAGTL